MSAANTQVEQAEVITNLISALWRVSLMLVFKRSLLNREWILISVLQPLASVISMCSLDVILLSKITIWYFTWLGIPSIQCKMSLRGPKSMREVVGPSLIFINFYVPVFTPCLNSTETSPQLSENIALFAGCRLYVCVCVCLCHQQRDRDRYQVFGTYHLYTYCTMWGRGRNLLAPLIVHPLA
jgi:hypothetical protein